jgi:isoquinoline 1-oxidoreductase subunit beta
MIFVTNGLSRRGLLRTGAAAGGGLLLSLSLPLGHGHARVGADFSPSTFIRIGNDGQIRLTLPYVENALGTSMSIPMLIAEELEVEVTQITLEHTSANPMRAAGGWTSTRAPWMPFRQTGAIARTMLVMAAALRWNVDPATCQARSGEVIHTSSGRRSDYGELAAHAGRLPAPETVALKRPEDFKLIGTRAKQADAQTEVTDKAVFGIDVRQSGVKIVTSAESPMFDGRVKSLDVTPAAVDHMGVANKSLAALRILKDPRGGKINSGPYQMLRLDKAPTIEVHIVPSQEPPGEMVNALFAATRERLRKSTIDTETSSWKA